MLLTAHTGTLIAPDLIATAGHCMQTAADCSNTRVVFNAINTTVLNGQSIPTNTVYACSAIVTQTLTSTQDWCIFRLTATVPSSVATPVTVGTVELPTGAPLMMIGHPSGLPRKYADDSTVRTVEYVMHVTPRDRIFTITPFTP
jgi:hypothetical protein